MKGFYDGRTRILIGIILLAYALLVVELLKKTVFSSSYYQRLSDSNAIRQIEISAPRGVFYDRNNELLTTNAESKRYTFLREYPYHELYAHVIGYVGLPSEKNLKDRTCPVKARSNELVGVYGLERIYECRLRGVPGVRYVMTNAQGEQQVELAVTQPKKGEDMYLTLDTRLQKAAAQALKGKQGAVLATNPTTGEVLAFYSSPAFDPQRIIHTLRAYGEYAADPQQPLFNRVVSGIYPPGSVVKPLYALGALEDGVIDERTIVEDTGVLEVGGTSFGNWYYLQYGKREGLVDVVKAIARSNDIFFYTLGIQGGEDKLVSWIKQFRYGKTDMDGFFAQTPSTLPDDAWKRERFGEQWYLGDTINLSIGQGYLLVSPTQVHSSVSLIASGGTWCPYRFEKGQKSDCTHQTINPQHLQLIRAGMRAACSTGGTGYPLFNYKVQGKSIGVACKTGTAESTTKIEDPHAWFTAFAPADSPSIVVTVLVEHGGEGSAVAAPIAKAVLDAYFTQ
ncbi:hypothetical protein COU89_00570 [Candidatus Roizmanbacteria bacterium CG10_big_fil_rev_8_21_14_0_10_45_7]|uniref:Penicillin-binding protein 2 n=1 Tax=Candidatus Roizmanbacteria bacterium CG10_big_fil_rev_8_21_14_0_10_45_7 TaxID=1974854 RepID=A0A2M8KVI3_9BACT|nr:MAG: hypothetical protein COU89_00570 [Candidatus Roizmanbacteria bacterium CG10_big_fil_rev_8_21_14_0_10_45_7]